MSNIVDGVRFQAPLPRQLVIFPHLSSLPPGYDKVGYAVKREHYRLFHTHMVENEEKCENPNCRGEVRTLPEVPHCPPPSP